MEKRWNLLSWGFFLALSMAFVACEDDQLTQTTDGKLEDNVPGEWNLVSVRYSGESPSPWDSTIVLPLSGEGDLVTGGFDFFMEDSVDYQIGFLANIDFGSGLTLSGDVDENGKGVYTVPHPDTLHVERTDGEMHDWYVITNTPSEQEWVSRYRLKPDGTPHWIEVDMRIKMIK